MGSKVAAPRIIPSQPGGERACHRKNQQRRIHHAYHEAGHALVGYVIGRCIEEVSIACKGEDYGGYCRFNSFIEDANNHPERRDDLGNLELITIDCAGMLATAYACAPYVTNDEEERCVEYPQGSERDDLVQIRILLTQIGTNEQQHKTITDACWMRAQQILWEKWPAVDALATALLKRERLSGRAAHRLIWQTIGYPEADWRRQRAESAAEESIVEDLAREAERCK